MRLELEFSSYEPSWEFLVGNFTNKVGASLRVENIETGFGECKINFDNFLISLAEMKPYKINEASRLLTDESSAIFLTDATFFSTPVMTETSIPGFLSHFLLFFFRYLYSRTAF